MKITTHATPKPAMVGRQPDAATRRCGGCGHTVAVCAGAMFWRGAVRRWLCNSCLEKKR